MHNTKVIIRMRVVLFFIFYLLFISNNFCQIVWLEPSSIDTELPATLYFNASEGNAELQGADKVYIHHGIVTEDPQGTGWSHVIGDWGQDNGVGLMTKVTGEENVWSIDFQPNIRSYFGADDNTNIFRIACVFRSADGTQKGTIDPGTYGWGTVADNLDFYIDLDAGQYVTIDQPSAQYNFYNPTESVTISSAASSIADRMSLFIDNGNGYLKVDENNGSKSLNFEYEVSSSEKILIKIEAEIGGEVVTFEKSHQIILKTPNEMIPLPDTFGPGINYHTDPNLVTLVLEAPKKEFVYVVGDMNDWEIDENFKMKESPGEGLFWLTFNVEPGREYVYQYWIDGELQIADPYTDKIADPWSDPFIESTVYPNLPEYDKREYGIASTFQTDQQEYMWDSTEELWSKPDVNHLVIYELHIRDFIESHSYTDLIDTINYLKELGINAIELLPISEFENNDSWGYNPSFYFAPDKYYGTKNDLKKFIEIAHQNGIAVILDMVLNHAFGQCPLVQMYFDRGTGKPTQDNPWFNSEYVGQYQWGYDFNHESEYTKRFMERVNKYWLEEYHFDGYRFDFTKGFTNYAPGGSIDGFDQSRIDILKRMADEIWSVSEDAYIILEHWGPFNEEQILGDYGMKMWQNKSYDYVPAAIGNPQGSFDGGARTSHVSFYNSHDERRIAEHCITEGYSTNGYSIKDSIIMFERVKQVAAFNYLMPGPKMIWQFDELGYDIHIDYNGRTGRKPLPWGSNSLRYYENEDRKKIYEVYKSVLSLRHTIGPDKLLRAGKNHKLSGTARRLVYNTDNIDLVLIGNFGLDKETIDIPWTETGTWYDYITGDSIQVESLEEQKELIIGEWRLYTNQKLSEGNPDLVDFYENPVTVFPFPFKKGQQITITYDASKGTYKGVPSGGLINAEKVYMHAGVIKEGNTQATNIVGTLQDDGIGLMTKVDQSKWEITLTPTEYFSLSSEEDITSLEVYFRNAANTIQGLGIQQMPIQIEVQSEEPIVQIIPPAFEANQEIQIIFDAKQGNGELVGAEKVYLHSSMGIVETETPQNNAWSFTKGNWGNDDGIGEMTKVNGESDKWQITLIPEQYYNLPEEAFPYWLAAVFRSQDGSIKGTSQAGVIENGFVHTNLDYFIANQGMPNIISEPSKVVISPNPNNGSFIMKGVDGEATLSIFSMRGVRIIHKKISKGESVNLEYLTKGTYIYKLQQGDSVTQGKFIVL